MQAVVMRVTVQGPVDQRHGLGTGDIPVGSEGPVLIALHQALVGRVVDVVLCPVTLDVREQVFTLIHAAEEADRDGRKLSAGDIPVGLERTVLIPLQDAGLGQSRDRIVIPSAALHIGEAADLVPVRRPILVGQHPEVDRCHLSAGDLPLRPHGLLRLVGGGLAGVVVHRVADDITVMVLQIQTSRHIVGDGDGPATTAAAALTGVGDGEA